MGLKNVTPIKALFFKGAYEKLVVEVIESPTQTPKESVDMAYLVGALVFRGRLSDANVFFEKYISKTDIPALVIAQFFLAVGASRDSDPDRARKLLISNWIHRGKLKNHPESLFYLFQGFGFYRNIACRFRQSIHWGELAWKCAFENQFTFGQFLSADLLGHGCVQVGEISRGLEFLDRAMSYSKRLGDGGIHSALEISILVYKIQYGILAKAEKPIRDALKTLSVEDTYSKSNLLIAKLRWLILCGRMEEARVLEKLITEHVFRFGHRRQKADLYLQQATMEWLQGHVELAKRKLAEAEAILMGGVDLRHILDTLELKQQIWGVSFPEVPKLKKIMGRRSQRNKDDAIGVLLDRVNSGEATARLLQTILQRGYLGMLRVYFKDSQQKICFLLDLIPKTLVLYLQGNVWVSSVPMTPSGKMLLRALAKKPYTKGDLVELLWGYEYNSLRHDPMLYGAIHRLRQTLGPYETYLHVNNQQYGFSILAMCKVFEHSVEKHDDTQSLGQEKIQNFQNLRQMKVLEYIQKKGALSVLQYSKIFHISVATAARDLKHLCVQKLVAKVGTKFFLPKSTNPIASEA